MQSKRIIDTETAIISLSKALDKPKTMFEFLKRGDFKIELRTGESNKTLSLEGGTAKTSIEKNVIVVTNSDLGITIKLTSQMGVGINICDDGAFSLAQKCEFGLEIDFDSKFLSEKAPAKVVDLAFKLTDAMDKHPENFRSISSGFDICAILLMGLKKQVGYDHKKISQAKDRYGVELGTFNRIKEGEMRNYFKERIGNNALVLYEGY